MKFLITGFVLSILFLMNSCTSRPVEPTRSSRHKIDTIFQNRTLALQPEMDSLCNLVFEKEYQKAVDSLMEERREEIEFLVK